MPAHQGFKPALENGTGPEASAKERSGNRPVSEDRVTITQNREKVLNLPEFDPDVGACPMLPSSAPSTRTTAMSDTG